MTILYLVDQSNFVSGSGMHTYITDMYEAIKQSKSAVLVLIIGETHNNNHSHTSSDFAFLAKSDQDFFKKFNLLVDEREIDIFHFHSIFDFNFQKAIVSKIKALGKRAVLTIHNNTLLCYKGTMAYKNKRFCNNNSSFNRCNACLSNRHKFGSAVYMINIINRFLRISTCNKFNYFELLQNFSDQSKYILTQMDSIVVLDNWVLKYLSLDSDLKSKTICISQSVKMPSVSKDINHVNQTLEKKLVYLGRTDLTKGLLLLIKAIKNMPGITLDCYVDVTDEKYFDKIKKEVEENKLSVKFFPLIDHSVLLARLLKYDLLCMPTFSEMSPLLSLEALSIKLPVLASDHPSFLSQAKLNEGIFTFKNGSIKSLQDKLKELSSRKVENVEYNAHYEDNILKYNSLYHSLLRL